MKIAIDISEKDYLAFCLQFDNGILDEKTPSHRAKIAIAEGTPLPEGAEILTKEAYSDLCLRASQEHKTGKWINRHYVGARSVDTVICSECREEFSYDAETGVSAEDYNFCPHCGAKMKGEEKVYAESNN